MQAEHDPYSYSPIHPAELAAAPRAAVTGSDGFDIVSARWKMTDLLSRITIDADKMHGRPCIRGLRITVADVLGLLSAGETREQILEDYPYLESADIDAALAFASRLGTKPA